MDYYSALTSKEILSRATTQMNLQDMMLSEINQIPRDKRHCSAHPEMIKMVNFVMYFTTIKKIFK